MKEEKKFIEKLIKLNRVSKSVRGGRKMSFSAFVVVGDGKGLVGYGFGKANDVSEAIQKSVKNAKRKLVKVKSIKQTLPHEVLGQYKKASVLLKPAAPGTGIIASSSVRAVMEAAGINDILTKSLGSKNLINIIKGVFNGFDNIMEAKKVAQNRGKTLNDLWN